jgi:hypothetical protein
LFHIDPNLTHAWNVSIVGRKKWIFYPPHICPPGVIRSRDGAEVTVPISTAEWLLTFWSFHLEMRKHPDPGSRPLEVVSGPGDLVFVPHGYWHTVINLDFNIALTQNYVSTSNLSDVLRFLRNKSDQISGCRDRLTALQPENFYEEFIRKLSEQEIIPREQLEYYLEESRVPIPIAAAGVCDVFQSAQRLCDQESKVSRCVLRNHVSQLQHGHHQHLSHSRLHKSKNIYQYSTHRPTQNNQCINNNGHRKNSKEKQDPYIESSNTATILQSIETAAESPSSNHSNNSNNMMTSFLFSFDL